MHKLKSAFLFVGLVSMLLSCSKKESTPTPPPPPPPAEENLVFSIDPDPGTSTGVANAENYNFAVKISSKLPTSGVRLDLTTKKESDNSTVDSKSIESSTSDISVSTGKLVVGTVYIVKVTLTSKSKSTNTASKEFKIARKS